MIRLEMILTEKQQKIWALSFGQIDKYEYLTGEEILTSDQTGIIEQAKFTYSLSGKSFEKQTKTTEEQEQKQVKALEVLEPEENKEENKEENNEEKIKLVEGPFPKEIRTNEMKNEIG